MPQPIQKAYRYREHCFIYSYPKGTTYDAQELIEEELPEASEDYYAWFCATTQGLDVVFEEYHSHLKKNPTVKQQRITESNLLLEVRPSSEYLSDEKFISPFKYEIDMEHAVVIIDGLPMFVLDRVPPWDMYSDAESREITNSYKHPGSLNAMFPRKYRFDPLLDTSPSRVDEGKLKSYKRLLKSVPKASPISPISVDDMFSDSSTAGLEVSVKFREACIGVCVASFGPSILKYLGLAHDRGEFTKWSKSIALTLATITLLPIHLIRAGNFRVRDRRYQQDGPFWWMRKHICLSLVTHLHTEEHLKAAVAELVEEIKKKPTDSSLVFGIAFSVFHCVLVRVNKDNREIVHTGALQFLPSFNTNSPTTPGITALVRLGQRPAPDDLPCFYASLLRLWGAWNDPRHPTVRNIRTPERPFNLYDLPVEILSLVAGFLDPIGLDGLATASKKTLFACIPHLRCPQLLPDSFPVGTKSCISLDTCNSTIPIFRSSSKFHRFSLQSNSFWGRTSCGESVFVVVGGESDYYPYSLPSCFKRLSRGTFDMLAVGPADFLHKMPRLKYYVFSFTEPMPEMELSSE